MAEADYMPVQQNAPWLVNTTRRIIRSPINRMDKSTIVSIYPDTIVDFKPTITPNKFEIPAGTFEKPACLVVGSASWWRDVDPEQPLIEVMVGSIVMADSIVKDWCAGLLACNMSDRMPGLFWVEGEIDAVKVKLQHKKELERVRDNQKRWFDALIEMADVDWARTNHNPLAVNDMMRLAAKETGRMDKPWMENTKALDMVSCPACGFLRNGAFPVCQHCHTIVDPELYKKLGLARA